MKKIVKNLVYEFDYLKFPVIITAVVSAVYLFIFWFLSEIPHVSKMVFFENHKFVIWNLPMIINFKHGLSMIWNIPIVFVFLAIIAVIIEYWEPDYEKPQIGAMFLVGYSIGAIFIGLFCSLISVSLAIVAGVLIVIAFLGLAILTGWPMEGLFLALGVLVGTIIGILFVAYIGTWLVILVLIIMAFMKLLNFLAKKLTDTFGD